MGNTRLVARRIVDRITKDLRDRRGFKHLFESIELEDPDTYQEIQDAMMQITEDELDTHVTY